MTKVFVLLIVFVGSVQGSLLLNALPAVLDDGARIALQDFVFMLFVARMLRLPEIEPKIWLHAPFALLCVAVMALVAVVQLGQGLASPELGVFDVFREARLAIYFFVPLYCFGAVRDWRLSGVPAKVFMILIICAGIGTAVYILLATSLVSDTRDEAAFSSAQDAIRSGFGHALHDKFKAPPLMVAFLSAFFSSFLISPWKTKKILFLVSGAVLSVVGIIGVFWISVESNTRSMQISFLVGIAIPAITEVSRAVFLFRPKRLLVVRSLVLLVAFGLLGVGGVIIAAKQDDKFVEQVLEKRLVGDQSDDVRFVALVKAVTFDMESPLGYGFGSGSDHLRFFMNPIDSAPFHLITTLGYQFFLPFMVLYLIALRGAFYSILARQTDGYEFAIRNGVFAGLGMGFVSLYQTSPLLFPAEALLLGSALGGAISIWSSAKKSYRYL